MSEPTALIYPYGEVKLNGVLKQNIEDFQVFEYLGFEPSGEGEHLYLWIEKQGITTDQVNQKLARHYQVKPFHISDCGLKDAKAITRQWFSVHLPGYKGFPEDLNAEDFKVLNKSWSSKKLKKGVHKGNHFEITIRDLSGDNDQAKQQIEQVKTSGFANYFGEQRFGKGQRNVQNAIDAFITNKKLSRAKRSLYLSSLRSFLFNEVLVKRIQQQQWHQAIEGDCFMLDGTRSTFCDALDETTIKRCAEGDIHPVISLMGQGEPYNKGLAKQFENEVFSLYPEITQILIDQGVNRDKRALRQNVQNLEAEFVDNSLRLKFYLPKGCYATTMIQHFCHY
ncbi:MAG: tRNA pseudouridine(13) synthase TruD [Gammaproteobacteria bacterium]|nr:tRNA pseudouridine(13) synthase TruD [Gammaproteobacteria bacterium]